MMMATYLTVIVPWIEPPPTEWHPTEPEFAPLSRGCFQNVREAHAWAAERLGGAPYSLRAFEDGLPPRKVNR